MTLLGSHSKTAQQEELRQARRLLKERVRADWDYPPLPAYQRTQRRTDVTSAGDEDARVAGFRFHVGGAAVDGVGAGPEDDGEEVEWRERECSSDSDSNGDDSAVTTSSKSSKKSKTSIFKFEGPDSVGEQIREQRQARKRKRQRALEQELGWNEGLQHWTTRRNAWSGARTAAEVRVLQSTQKHHYNASPAPRPSSSSSVATDSAVSTPRTSVSSMPAAEAGSSSTASSQQASPNNNGKQSTLPTVPSSASHTQSAVMVPVCPAILPNHPIRRRINPAMHHEIYNKIILQSRTPSVPINLLTLVSALVQGWKEDGDWPPKDTAPEPSIGRRKTTKDAGEIAGGLKNGVKAVGRVLRLTAPVEMATRNRKEQWNVDSMNAPSSG
ncbi:hypothetical protein BAUCODRAFT_532348 [Baudoinia panamericana UAMH 10762]|uniref:Gag1-like clamp domain-containing protein n=1 Tax=Baudoinia panamericana (strain UAMH 10762) TaxID=717646 RepID=M2MF36_BAUPA|nr:uncharacterized protein BAUCODRAFT_532348 [Baudoinia panamericana UAMH 10762]EMC95236.1 hypothetical protein BAUCODRAFT_532348 [Baudoinia panamericana UAMH 10762]